MKNLFIIAFIATIISGCSQNSTEKQTTDQQEPASELSSKKASNQNMENWGFLLDSRWYILLKDSVNGQRKYIEPACLSSSGSIDFKGAGKLEELAINCGQHGVIFKIESIESNKSNLIIEYGNNGGNGKIEIIRSENFENLPYQQIAVRVTAIDDLLLGYYPNNILELNKQEAVYIIDKEGTLDFLRENGLYSKLPCDDDVYD